MSDGEAVWERYARECSGSLRTGGQGWVQTVCARLGGLGAVRQGRKRRHGVRSGSAVVVLFGAGGQVRSGKFWRGGQGVKGQAWYGLGSHGTAVWSRTGELRQGGSRRSRPEFRGEVCCVEIGRGAAVMARRVSARHGGFWRGGHGTVLPGEEGHGVVRLGIVSEAN